MANSKTRFLLGFSDLRFSEDAGRSRNGSSRSRKGRAISDARPSAQKGTHAMERESRPSDSDSTLRSVLSPLRPPVPDVDEQFRNLELNPPSLVLIEGDKISKEPSHESCLRAFWKKLGARVRSHAEFRVIYPLGVLNRGTERRGGDEGAHACTFETRASFASRPRTKERT